MAHTAALTRIGEFAQCVWQTPCERERVGQHHLATCVATVAIDKDADAGTAPFR